MRRKEKISISLEWKENSSNTHKKKNSKRKNQNAKELSTMMLKKLQYIGSRIYSLNTLYPKKERDRGAG